MCLYKTHVKFNVFLGLPIFLFGLFHYEIKMEYILTFSAFFIYSTLFMNPDMDLANKIKLLSFKGLLTFPFRIYSKIFRHRGISHQFLLGTLTRIIFLSFFLVIPLILFDVVLSKQTLIYFCQKYEYYILFSFAGVCSSDLCHILLDLKK